MINMMKLLFLFTERWKTDSDTSLNIISPGILEISEDFIAQEGYVIFPVSGAGRSSSN